MPPASVPAGLGDGFERLAADGAAAGGVEDEEVRVGELHGAAEVAHLPRQHHPGALDEGLLGVFGVEERRGDLRGAALQGDDEVLAARAAVAPADLGAADLPDQGDVLAGLGRFGGLPEHPPAVAVLARVVAQQIVDGADAEHLVEQAGGALAPTSGSRRSVSPGHRYSTPISRAVTAMPGGVAGGTRCRDDGGGRARRGRRRWEDRGVGPRPEQDGDQLTAGAQQQVDQPCRGGDQVLGHYQHLVAGDTQSVARPARARPRQCRLGGQPHRSVPRARGGTGHRVPVVDRLPLWVVHGQGGQALRHRPGRDRHHVDAPADAGGAAGHQILGGDVAVGQHHHLGGAGVDQDRAAVRRR